MNDNLYQPPSAPISGSAYSGDENIPAGVIDQLVRTQFWVRVVSVAGLIVSVVIVACLFLPYAVFSPRYGNRDVLLGPLIIMALLLAFLLIYPLVRLSKYASAIARLKMTRSGVDLENALMQQRLFWRFIGVLLLIGVSFWVLSFMIAMFRPS
jgi:hypothetical protein